MKTIITSHSVTKRTANLEIYFNQIKPIPLLSSEQELRLSLKIAKGDLWALERIINASLRFVVSVAKKYQFFGLDLEDLIAEGNIGLITAAKKFDATKGFKFISFAVWWIRQSILRALTEKKRTIRLPRNQVLGIAQVRLAEAKLEQELERSPTVEEISTFMNLPLIKIKDFLSSAAVMVSLDGANDDEECFSLLEVIPDENVSPADTYLMAESKVQLVGQILNVLSDRERLILSMTFGVDGYAKSELSDIAIFLNITRERVRQILCQLLRDLKARFGDDSRYRYFSE